MKTRRHSFDRAALRLLVVCAVSCFASSQGGAQDDRRSATHQTFYSEQLGMTLTIEIPAISNGAMAQMRASSFHEVSDQVNHKSPLQSSILSGQSLVTIFETIDFDRDGENHLSGGSRNFHIPPDPIGAAGPNHVVCVVNTSIEIYTKTGTRLDSRRLGTNAGGSVVGSFFAPLTPANNTFDPKVIYDQYENRFLVVTLEMTEAPTSSRILVAVSATSDPTGTWFFHAINSKIFISGADRWADYPGFAVDEDAVYITNNMFGFGGGTFAGTRLWIIRKGVVGGFYGGGTATVTVHDPYAAAGFAGTTQPAHVFGAGGIPGGTIGTFLVSYGGLTNGGAGGLEFGQIVRVDNPLTTPTFTQEFVSLGDIEDIGGVFGFPDLPDAPQTGSATAIEVNDRRTLNAVWRSNSMWVTTTINPRSGPDAGQTTAHWIRFNTAGAPGGPITLADQGDVGGEDIAAGTFTFFPSIAVDASGNAGFGYSASAPTIFPGAYWTGRLAADPAGTMRASRVLRAGVDFYVRRFGGTRNRWGDYSGMSIDPSNGSFWVFNEFAMARGTVIPPSGEDGRWRTAFGNFTAAEITSVGEETLPEKTALLQNYPNPFNPSTTISYTLALSGFVSLRVFNVIGEELAALVNEEKPAGEHSVNWTPANLASGVYFYRLQSGGFVDSKKLLLLK